MTVTYTYKKNQTAMNVHDSTIYVGDKWSTKSNWDSTLNMDGESVDFAEVEKNGKIEGNVDTSTPGTYQVTYTYQDATAVATVTVKPNLGQMNVHDSTIYVGDDWKAEDNFDSALDKDGNTVDFSKLTVDDSKKDTSKAGTFGVTYSYDGVTSTAKVTVKDHSVPVIPDKPKATIPPTHVTSSKGKATKTSPKSKTILKVLPKTGEKTGWILTGSGFSIMLLLIGYLLTKTKRNNK
ncbi:bacterial Ig-like domain-containing protein [Lactococcus lactis]|uniref:LPXTG-motif cell wall-anchored protein n=1 Tax=Lactococcus lactis TaxID=1358 RepID=A0AAW5TVA6_9LACT|nr:bacterial Ig-like domain-containing protein [Lactococcus lactis]MCW2281529.1 LPXTG-motif cell wall-anchored protein [Lactococcus lactis]